MSLQSRITLPLALSAALVALPAFAQAPAAEAKVARAQALASPQGSGDGPPSATYRSPLGMYEERDSPKKDDPYGRLDWERLYFGGDFDRRFTERLVLEARRERARFPHLFPTGPQPPGAVAGSTWTSLGPTSATKSQNGIVLNVVDSGRLRTILPHPTNPDIVYVLTNGGGLWKTTNFTSATTTWTPTMDQVGSTSGGSASFGRDPNTIYLGVGDPFSGNYDAFNFSGIGGFMISSTDGAQTWGAPVFLGDISTQVRDVKVDTSTANDIVIVATNTGIFRSTNGGASYAASGLNGLSVWSLARSSAGWLATAQIPNRSQVASVYLSTDQGATWTAVANGGGRLTLGIGQPGDSIVYLFATTQDQSAQWDLFRSTDGGVSWLGVGLNPKVPTNPNGDQPDMNLMHGQASYNHMILVDPTDAGRNTVYLGGNLSSAVSINGGTSWTILSSWLPGGNTGTATLPYVHADFHCAAFWSNGSTKRIFFGSDGGLFVSENGGTIWNDKKNSGLVSHIIFAIASNSTAGNKKGVLAGLQDNGTRFRVGTSTVFDAVKGGDGFGVGMSQANTAWSLGTYVFNDIALCTVFPPDDQSKWSDFTAGLGPTGSGGTGDNGTSYYFVTPIIGAPASSDATSPNPGMNFFTYGNNGTGPNSGKIFKSTPTAWTVIGTPGVGGLSASTYVRAGNHSIGVSPVDVNHLAASRNGGILAITTNGGAAWTERQITALGLPSWPNFNASVAWASNTKIYLSSIALAPGALRVAKSTDGGATWSAAATGLPDLPVEKLVVDPGDASGNTVYAASFIGVYRTTDGGASWARFGTGLPQCRVTDIYVSSDGKFLRVATWGRGVWELGDSSDTGGGGGSTTQVLQNEGFEAGNTIWIASNVNIIDNSTNPAAHTGTWKAWLGSYQTPQSDSLYQTVTIPAGASAAELTFWQSISNNAGTPSTTANTCTLKVRNGAGADLATLATWDNTVPTSGYIQRGPYHLAGYKGQTVQIYLTSTQTGGNGTGTSFLVDDFALNVTTGSTSSAPSVTTFAPTSGTVGTTVTLTGNGFTGTTAVKFNGVSATTFSVASDTSLSATVPSGATSGTLSVTTPTGTGTSAGSFTVTVIPVVVSITPANGVNTVVGGQLSFTATVTGTSNTDVWWGLLGGGGSFFGGGATSTANPVTFLAPSVPSQTELVAHSMADSSALAYVMITTWQGDIFDLPILARAYGARPGDPNWNSAADLNGDGMVNDLDLALFFVLAGF